NLEQTYYDDDSYSPNTDANLSDFPIVGQTAMERRMGYSKYTDTNQYNRTKHYLIKKYFDEQESENGDPGVESEYDILYASGDYDGFDTSSIHYRNLNSFSLDSTVVLPLISGKKGKFVSPLTEYHISSRFGPRRRRFHYGIDLAMPTGTPVYSVFEGTVRVAKRNRSYGNLVVIRHKNGIETYYAHLSQIDVHSGQEVKAGEQIGLVGNTGRSFGSHLHFETRYLGSAMNPEAIVNFEDKKLVNDTLYITSNLFRHKKSSAQYAKNSTRSSGKYHKVRKGDTLGAIAKRNRTTVKRLCQLNGIRKNSTLRPGQKLRVR
ncbi:MAG: peptidoglycan DD-metalloendopeptidase family protein, partial [Bacteroidales bacterium]|nr:peptidoglycan DD-metalloendopeptidase family protein [Bacteroidales bacterium]